MLYFKVGLFNNYAVTLTAKYNKTLASIADSGQSSSMFLYRFSYLFRIYGPATTFYYIFGFKLVTSVSGTAVLEFVVTNSKEPLPFRSKTISSTPINMGMLIIK